LADQARGNVSRPCSREGNDYVHRPRWIGLSPSQARDSRQRGCARGKMQKIPSGYVHSVTPVGCAAYTTQTPAINCECEQRRQTGQWISECSPVDDTTLQTARDFGTSCKSSPKPSYINCSTRRKGQYRLWLVSEEQLAVGDVW